jgi:hypothetical protein
MQAQQMPPMNCWYAIMGENEGRVRAMVALVRVRSPGHGDCGRLFLDE